MSVLKSVIPKTGKIVSRLGFGSYRVNQEKHAQALVAAIESGINIIDTAHNFEQGKFCSRISSKIGSNNNDNCIGASERWIGNTLEKMISDRRISREVLYIYKKKRMSFFLNDKKDVAIVTKSGYLTSSDTSLFSPSDYVQLNEKSYHSISPKVIEKQIETSLQRLKTNKIDIFMINAPERMLMAKNKVYHYIYI